MIVLNPATPVDGFSMPHKSTDTLGGWFPGADPIGIPEGNYAVGNDNPLAVVLHIIDGSLVSCISEFTAPKQKSSHFGIGKNGSVKQFVSIKDTSFANGLGWNKQRSSWVDPEGNILSGKNKPPWGLLHPPRNPNYYTITIEREGKPADIPTEAMDKATIALLRWLAEQYPLQLRPYRPLVNLIGHRHIGPVHRANCPGPHVDFSVLAARVNNPIVPAPPPQPDWEALWGPIASPDQTTWEWDLPRLWKTHHARLGKCIGGMMGAADLIVQCFEGGDIRGRIKGDTTTYEVCFK